MIQEFHTTDLTEPCLKSVQLRHEGKRIARMTSALYRGCLWHEAARMLHERDAWENDLFSLVLQSNDLVMARSKEEDRPISEACERNRHETMAEVGKLLARYTMLFSGIFRRAKLIGCELPVRLTMDVDGEPAEFATHADLLFRGHDGALCLWDWKTGEDSPTWEYLTRNLQFGMMHMGVAHGEVCVGDDHWVRFNEAPMMKWVHVNYLAPYGRTTTVGDVTFKKGDARPIESVLRDIPVNDEGVIVDEFSTRVRMARAGHFPMIPSETGCHLCESNQFCPNFQRGNHANE